MEQLTDRQREIITFERTWWKYAGAKDTAIRTRFDVSPTRYYQELNQLLEHPLALAHDATTVRRLQRLAEERRRQRSGRRLRSA